MVNNPLILNDVFSALADPTRRGILGMLHDGERIVSEVAQAFKISGPAISKHLRVLERANLLRREKRGREHYLTIEAAPLAEATGWLEQYRAFWDNNLDALDSFLQESSNTNHQTNQDHDDDSKPAEA